MNDMLIWLRAQWDRVAAWVSIVLGALALLLGWLGVSNTAYPAAQLPYIVSGGLVGIFLLGVGALLWLSADLRDTWRKLDELARTEGDGDLRASDAVEVTGQAGGNGAESENRRRRAPLVATRQEK